MSMCIHVKFMSTQNVTVNVHYLPLCSVSRFVFCFIYGGLQLSDMVVLALQLDRLVPLNG